MSAPILDKQAEIEAIYRRYLEPEPTGQARPPEPGDAGTAPSADTSDILERMFASKHGAEIRRLRDGDTSGYDSASEADLAWINHCAWWADYDPQRTEELAKQSALYRSKWDELRGEQTYLQRTIAKACEGKRPGDGYRPSPRQSKSTFGTGAAGRPEIVVNGRWLRDIAADAMAALEAANNPPYLFVRGTVPARVNSDKAEALTATSLKGILDRSADFVKETTTKAGKTELVPARPPSDLAPDLLTHAGLAFPPLEDIVHSPVYVAGGELLAQDGYSAETGLLMRLQGLSGLRADTPVDVALARLREVFGQFPFTESAGWAHTLSMVLQPFVRPLIRGATPMYLIDAPARGTGKGLLAEAACLIPTGKIVATMSPPQDGDELEKRLTAVLLEGRGVVFLDNVSRLDSQHLCAVLTSEVWQGRILGKSETVTVPNRALWLASGNNITLSDEMVRRVVPIRLDAGVERPEERTGFKHAPLAEYVRAHRSELVSACLSLIRHWVAAGMPQGTATLGRFEVWAGAMGGILEVAGVPGFLGGRERLHAEADSDTKAWCALCERWYEAHAGLPVAARDVFEVAKTHGLILDVWAGRSQQGAMQRIGHALASRRDRVFGGYKIVGAGRDGITRNAAYRLAEGGYKTPETPETTGQAAETPSQTANEARLFWADNQAKQPETTAKQPQNNRSKNTVQDGIIDPPPGVSGVSVVLNDPSPDENEKDTLTAEEWDDDEKKVRPWDEL